MIRDFELSQDGDDIIGRHRLQYDGVQVMTNHTYTARIYAPEGFVVRMTVSDWKTLDQIALNTKCKTLHIDIRRLASKELVCERIGDSVFLLSDEPQLSGETKELVFNRTV